MLCFLGAIVDTVRVAMFVLAEKRVHRNSSITLSQHAVQKYEKWNAWLAICNMCTHIYVTFCCNYQSTPTGTPLTLKLPLLSMLFLFQTNMALIDAAQSYMHMPAQTLTHGQHNAHISGAHLRQYTFATTTSLHIHPCPPVGH